MPSVTSLLISPILSRGKVTWTRQADGDSYIPHPAPGAAGNEDEEAESKMGSALSLIKTLLVPAIISLILYLLVSFLIVPIWKRYRGRYSNYLPIDAISTQTTSFRHKVQEALVQLLVPSSWRTQFERSRQTASAQDGLGSEFDDEDGEELFDVDDNRREALSLDARRGRDDDGRRLSRDLEEGFKDDSDEETESDQHPQIVSR
ncbi:hypothetical protein HYFRA_00001543 [Hymenoscyphus fraxineus]|uniref:Uncharacterized protein n=1 Tax=Hymenoscyphus fraxineus TaxID=746836 RepID=A0A9N9L8G8_9HELO|nr:hypothetical protein HYFRA_00001543 [Hymenoscyphus fraxineus]